MFRQHTSYDLTINHGRWRGGFRPASDSGHDGAACWKDASFLILSF